PWSSTSRKLGRPPAAHSEYCDDLRSTGAPEKIGARPLQRIPYPRPRIGDPAGRHRANPVSAADPSGAPPVYDNLRRMSAIPAIDIAALAEPESAAAASAARDLCRAYEDLGFAYVTGHGVSRLLVDDAFAASAAFHASPIECKRALAINGFHRGYLGFA